MSSLVIHVAESAKAPRGTFSSRILSPLENTIKISRSKVEPGLVPPYFIDIRVDGAFVLLIINDKAGHLTTTQAHEAGIAILHCARDCEAYELVYVSVNNEKYSFSPHNARRLAKKFLFKADAVDEIQLTNKLRIIK